MAWADGRRSWVKECNLPQTVRANVKNGMDYQQEVVPIYEFGQKRIEFQQTSQSTPDQPNTTAAAVQRYPKTIYLLGYITTYH